MKRFFGILVLFTALVTQATAGVMMQGFYWDYTMGGTWWDTLKANATAPRAR